MTRARISLSLLVALVVTAGCGGAEGGSLAPELVLQKSWLVGDETLQLAVLESTSQSGSTVSCTDAESTCLADQLGQLRVAELDTSSGDTRVLRVPLDLTAAQTGEGQSVVVEGIPVGSGYLLLVEVGRDDGTGSGEQRVAVGCAPIGTIVKGRNPAPSSPISLVETGGDCGTVLP